MALIDLKGQKFTRLTVIKKVPSKHNKARWLCQCDCGTMKEVNGQALREGRTKSCGCLQKEEASKKHTRDLTNQKFKRLLVVKKVRSKTNKARWLCLCDCGTLKEIDGQSLTQGGTHSCGCLNRENHTKHGLWESPEYAAYHHMILRCYDPNNPAYKDYGRRGIKVCDRWLGEDGFVNFYKDLGPRPGSDYSLEREDNDKGYSPDNCDWIEKKYQSRNQRSNKIKDLEEAEFIRDLHKLGHSTKDLAMGMNCSRSFINNIINNKLWKT